MSGEKEAIINLDGKVSPAILASIFGCNVSLVYQEVQAGRLPNPVIEHTYRECIQAYLTYFKKNQDLKIEKEKNEARLKELKLEKDLEFKDRKHRAKLEAEEKAREAKGSRDFSLGDDGMPPLMAAKTKQDIRLGKAREQQLWIKASIERGEYLSVTELVELCEPLIMTIRQSLLSIALENETVQRQVDQIMENLYQLGTSLVEQADFDSNRFITTIMNQDIDITEIDIDSLPEPVL